MSRMGDNSSMGMFYLLVLLLISVPIEIDQDVIYSPITESILNPGDLSGKKVWLCHLRIIDSLDNRLLPGVLLSINPIEKSCLIKQGRAKLALKPGLYTFELSKDKYYQKKKRVKIIPEEISMVKVVMAKREEVIEQEMLEARIGSLMTIGVGLFNVDSLIKAEEIFREVLLLDSTHPGARNNLKGIETKKMGLIVAYKEIADSLTRKRKYQEAIEAWNRILFIDSANQDAKRQIEKLKKRLKTKSVVTREDVERFYQTGVKLFINGKYVEALQIFKKVLRYSPNHGGAKKYLRRTEARIGSKE